MIHVVAIVTTKPGQREAYLEKLREITPAVRAEPGCIEYGAAVDAQPALRFQAELGGDTFVVIEKWDSMEALKAHAAAPHVVDYGARTRHFIEHRAIHILSPTTSDV